MTPKPRCPKCGSVNLTIKFGDCDYAECRDCLRYWSERGGTDFAQFFPTPEEARGHPCDFHGKDRTCNNATEHHFLKYHDPRSEHYIGGECIACCFGQVDRERPSPPRSPKEPV